MFWYILIGTLLVLGILFCIFLRKFDFEYIKPFLIGIGIVSLVAVLVSNAMLLFGGASEYEEKLTKGKEKPLLCINDNLNTEGYVGGSLFLTSGKINTKLYYYYMYEDKDGFINSNSVPADKAKIKYISKSDTPKIIPLVKKAVLNKSQIFWFSLFPESKYSTSDDLVVEYEIYIPENSITNEYKIDLKGGEE